MSLRCLTGHVGDFEADDWDAWLAAHEGPLRRAQRLCPGAARRRIRSGGGSGEAMNEMWTAWQGPSKPTAKPTPAAAVKQAEGQRMIMEAAQQ